VFDVLAPATLGPVRLRNRTVKAATFEGRTPRGRVTDGLVDFHTAVARGGVGMTTVAYLAVAPEGRTHREVVVVGPDTEAGLARLAEAVHAEGAAVSGQQHQFRPQVKPFGRGLVPQPLLKLCTLIRIQFDHNSVRCGHGSILA
jgi:2,4-dienoyl-CoA reductase-like NADH-dependent reductase (Old Yellow Enzyme family)